MYIYIYSFYNILGWNWEWNIKFNNSDFFLLYLTWNQLIFFKQSISTVVFFVDCIRFRKVGTNNTSDVCWFINPIISTSSIYPPQNHSCWTYEPTNQSPLEAPCHVEKTRIPVETTVSRWSKDLHKSLQQPSRITGQLGIAWIKLVCFSMRNPMLCGVSNVEEHSSRSPWLILCHWQSIIVNKYIYIYTYNVYTKDCYLMDIIDFQTRYFFSPRRRSRKGWTPARRRWIRASHSWDQGPRSGVVWATDLTIRRSTIIRNAVMTCHDHMYNYVYVYIHNLI